MTLTQNEIEVLKDAIGYYQDAICGGSIPPIPTTNETMDILQNVLYKLTHEQ